jgi:hypothetical protein
MYAVGIVRVTVNKQLRGFEALLMPFDITIVHGFNEVRG